MTPRDQALDWFVRLQGPDVGPADRAAFAAWRQADPAHEAAWRRTQAMWDAPELAAAVRRLDPGPARPAVWRRAAAMAAALLVAALLAWQFDLPLRLQADHIAATGEQPRLTLADGSRIVLDTASAVAVDMGGATRQVRLIRGAAYFDVTGDPGRPFEVTAGLARVRVVGTAFAVRYLGGRVTVTVRHGTVEVGGARLTAGQEIVAAAGVAGPVREANLTEALAWVDGRLVFADRPLSEVVAELSRYHRGLMLVADDRLAGLRVTGNYRLADPPRAAAALAEFAPATLTRLGDAVLILR